MRFIFDKQVAMGEWEFSPMCHYGFREADWKETLRRFRDAAVDPANVRDGTGPRLLVEARNEWGASEAFERTILRDLKETRAELEARAKALAAEKLARVEERWQRGRTDLVGVSDAGAGAKARRAARNTPFSAT
mgnify:CR=1 FL=1